MSTALKYLLKQEWSMGNGQCPECCGVPADWHGHPCHFDAATIGHRKNCQLANAIRVLGGKPLMLGDFKSDKQFEWCTSDNGFYYVREKQ